MMRVELWTDGSCWPNPGPSGSWAAILRVIEDDGTVFEREASGRVEAHCTNQRMEILAAAEGLRLVNRPSEVTIFSDSQYVVKTMTYGWKRRRNLDLWERLDQAATPHSTRWQWVPGHSGIELNERADLLADEARVAS
jgi:ribonuclease HI